MYLSSKRSFQQFSYPLLADVFYIWFSFRLFSSICTIIARFTPIFQCIMQHHCTVLMVISPVPRSGRQAARTSMRSIFRRLPLTAPSRRPLPLCCTRWCTSTAWRPASREKAEEFKRISDRTYGKLLGEGQSRITTEIIER